MQVGLFGGSFNPPHAGHALVAEIALKRLALDQLWWIVTPGNPLKSNNGRAPLAERLRLSEEIAKNPRIKAFAQVLMDAGIVTTVRKTRGDDIDAACGQLAGEVQDRTRVAQRMEKMAEYQKKFGADFGRIVEIPS